MRRPLDRIGRRGAGDPGPSTAIGGVVVGAGLSFVGFCLAAHVGLVYAVARWDGGRRSGARGWDVLAENWMFALPAFALLVVGYRLMIGSRAD